MRARGVLPSRASVAGALALAVAISLATPAYAQQGGADAEAKALFQAGRVAFGEGRFDSALNYFRQAYQLSPRPALLYNIGSAADRLRRDAEALAAFEQYLEQVPDAENRAEVEARIKVLREATAPQPVPALAPTPTAPGPAATQPPVEAMPPAEATAPPPPEPEPATAPEGRGSELAPWIVIGVSGAVLVTGGVMLALAMSDISTVENAADGTRWAEIRDAHDRAPTLSGLGIGLAAAGAAGVAVGAMWLGMNDGNGAEIRLGLYPGGVQVGGKL